MLCARDGTGSAATAAVSGRVAAGGGSDRTAVGGCEADILAALGGGLSSAVGAAAAGLGGGDVRPCLLDSGRTGVSAPLRIGSSRDRSEAVAPPRCGASIPASETARPPGGPSRSTSERGPAGEAGGSPNSRSGSSGNRTGSPSGDDAGGVSLRSTICTSRVVPSGPGPAVLSCGVYALSPPGPSSPTTTASDAVSFHVVLRPLAAARVSHGEASRATAVDAAAAGGGAGPGPETEVWPGRAGGRREGPEAGGAGAEGDDVSTGGIAGAERRRGPVLCASGRAPASPACGRGSPPPPDAERRLKGGRSSRGSRAGERDLERDQSRAYVAGRGAVDGPLTGASYAGRRQPAQAAISGLLNSPNFHVSTHQGPTAAHTCACPHTDAPAGCGTSRASDRLDAAGQQQLRAAAIRATCRCSPDRCSVPAGRRAACRGMSRCRCRRRPGQWMSCRRVRAGRRVRVRGMPSLAAGVGGAL